MQEIDERLHLLDHLHQLGQRRVVVLLGHPVEPLKVVLVELQVGVQLGECGLQLKGGGGGGEEKKSNFTD